MNTLACKLIAFLEYTYKPPPSNMSNSKINNINMSENPLSSSLSLSSDSCFSSPSFNVSYINFASLTVSALSKEVKSQIDANGAYTTQEISIELKEELLDFMDFCECWHNFYFRIKIQKK